MRAMVKRLTDPSLKETYTAVAKELGLTTDDGEQLRKCEGEGAHFSLFLGVRPFCGRMARV